MRSASIMTLVLLLSFPALGETTDQPRQRAPSYSADELLSGGERHHQPSQAEVDEREDARFRRPQAGASQSLGVGNDRVRRRFLDACMTRLHIDEPLGSEQNHRAFCTCRIDALVKSSTLADLDAIALNIEERNVAKVAISRLPADANRSNQAAIEACMSKLSP